MIIHLKESVSHEEAGQLAERAQAQYFRRMGQPVLITSSGIKEMPSFLKEYADEHFVMA